MKVNPKQSETASSELEWKHLAVNNRDLELISKALANMISITRKIYEDNTNFSNLVRFEIGDLSDEYLKLKSKIDLI